MSARTVRSGALAAAASAAAALAPPASAATANATSATANATWAGGASSGLWSGAGTDGANWRGTAVPGSSISTLSFPDLTNCDAGTQATSCYSNVDDLGPATVGQISIGGGREYQIYPTGSNHPPDSITLDGNHPGALRSRNVGLVARPTGRNLQLAKFAVPIILGHDQTWEVRHYGILYLDSISGKHALALDLSHGWVQADDIETGPLTISGPGELQLDQAAGSPERLPNVTVNDSLGRGAGLGVSSTNATAGSIHIAGTDNKFIVLTDRAPGETLLHVSGNVTLDPTTTAEFEIDGNDTTPGNESSQLRTQGRVDFHGARISLWQERDAGACEQLTSGGTFTLLHGGALSGPIRIGGRLISRGRSAPERLHSNSCARAARTTAVIHYRARALTATIGRHRPGRARG